MAVSNSNFIITSELYEVVLENDAAIIQNNAVLLQHKMSKTKIYFSKLVRWLSYFDI